ncbi:MAG: hypothetical protein IPL10_20600 [Bacteroidetes bacterium]|nr:hypothetical protein [Bacteroidota bacterium]
MLKEFYLKLLKKGELVHHADTVCTKSYFIQRDLCEFTSSKMEKKLANIFQQKVNGVIRPEVLEQDNSIFTIDAIEDIEAYCLNVSDLLFYLKTFQKWKDMLDYQWVLFLGILWKE